MARIVVFCRSCLADFPDHFVVEARARSRWRGKSFDAEEAQSELGLALAGIMGVSISDVKGFERFARAFTIKTVREAVDLNPDTPIAEGEGEKWWFHVGIRERFPDDVLARMRTQASTAVAASRNFAEAHVL